MAVELASIHAVGDGGVLAVAISRVFAGGAGVLGANVKTMSPAVVHVVAVSAISLSSKSVVCILPDLSENDQEGTVNKAS